MDSYLPHLNWVGLYGSGFEQEIPHDSLFSMDLFSWLAARQACVPGGLAQPQQASDAEKNNEPAIFMDREPPSRD
jgi:hypothetical protein